MRKILFILSILAVSISCSQKSNSDTDNSQAKITLQNEKSGEELTFERASYDKEEIHAFYPKFNNKYVNFQIKKKFKHEFEHLVSAKTDYTVYENDKDIISIAFNGPYFVTDMISVTELTAVSTINIDRKTNRLMKLDDLILLDEAFSELLKSKVPEKFKSDLHSYYLNMLNFMVESDSVTIRVAPVYYNKEFHEVKLGNNELKFVADNPDKDIVTIQKDNLDIRYRKTNIKEIDDEIAKTINSYINDHLMDLRVWDYEHSDTVIRPVVVSIEANYDDGTPQKEKTLYYHIDVPNNKEYQISDHFKISTSFLDFFYLQYLHNAVEYKPLTYREFLKIFDHSGLYFDNNQLKSVSNDKLFFNYYFETINPYIFKEGKEIDITDEELDKYPEYIQYSGKKNSKHLDLESKTIKADKVDIRYPIVGNKEIDERIKNLYIECLEKGGQKNSIYLDYIITENGHNLSTIYLYGYYKWAEFEGGSGWYKLDTTFSFDLDDNNKLLKLTDIIKVDDNLVANIYELLDREFNIDQIKEGLNDKHTLFTLYDYGIRIQFPGGSNVDGGYYPRFAVPNQYLEYINIK